MERDEAQRAETKTVLLARLRQHPDNPRNHPEHQLAFLEKSLDRFGQIKPIVVQEIAGGNYRLYAGHGVSEAARRLGWETIEAKVLPMHWSDEQCNGYMLVDNNRGVDNEDILIELWERQIAAGYDLESVGTSIEEYEALLAERDIPISTGAGEKRPTMVPAERAKKQIKPVLTIDQIGILEQALTKTGISNRGEAFTAICLAFLENNWVVPDGREVSASIR